MDTPTDQILKKIRKAQGIPMPLASVPGAPASAYLIGFRGDNYVLLVRPEGGAPTEEEARFLRHWYGHAEIVSTLAEALGAIEYAYHERLQAEAEAEAEAEGVSVLSSCREAAFP